MRHEPDHGDRRGPNKWPREAAADNDPRLKRNREEPSAARSAQRPGSSVGIPYRRITTRIPWSALTNRLLRAVTGGRQPPPPSEPTARAMTSKAVSSAAVACSPINALARLVSGIVSVGLKALELVRDT
jgi:hypothetical protein